MKFTATATKATRRTNSEGKTLPTWQVPDHHGWYTWPRPLYPEEFIAGALRHMPDGATVKVTVETLNLP